MNKPDEHRECIELLREKINQHIEVLETLSFNRPLQAEHLTLAESRQALKLASFKLDQHLDNLTATMIKDQLEEAIEIIAEKAVKLKNLKTKP